MVLNPFYTPLTQLIFMIGSEISGNVAVSNLQNDLSLSHPFDSARVIRGESITMRETADAYFTPHFLRYNHLSSSSQ